MKREDFDLELKQLIVKALELEDTEPSDIKTDEPLFGTGLGLASIDALELGMALKKRYEVTFESEQQENKKYFQSVATLRDYIAAKKAIVFDE